MKNKDKWWLTKDVIRIQANHWKTFELGLKIGYILGKVKGLNKETK